jgi:hypothetical protein
MFFPTEVFSIICEFADTNDRDRHQRKMFQVLAALSALKQAVDFQQVMDVLDMRLEDQCAETDVCRNVALDTGYLDLLADAGTYDYSSSDSFGRYGLFIQDIDLITTLEEYFFTDNSDYEYFGEGEVTGCRGKNSCPVFSLNIPSTLNRYKDVEHIYN